MKSIFGVSLKTDCLVSDKTNITQQFKMASLKQTIVNAIIKVTQENPALNVDGQAPFEEARNDFIRLLMKELFPECPDIVLPTDADRVTIPTPDPVDSLTEQVKTLKIEEKKKPAPRKPKAKKEEAPVNLAKLDATQSKQLTAVAKQLKVKADKKAFLEYINNLSAEEYNAEGMKLEDHMRKFMTPAPTETPEPVVEKKEDEEPTELVSVEFEDEEYYVDEVSKRVFRAVGEWKDGKPAGWEKVGYVGMANFKDMVIPPPDDE